jgi:hypothetical protein
MVLTRNMPKDNLAYQFFSRWTTGPLAENAANRYDWLHRLYNPQVRQILLDYMRATGKNLNQLDENDLKTIAANVQNAGGSAQQFLDRLYKLNPNATPIGNSIDSILDAAKNALSKLWQEAEPAATEIEGLATQAGEAYESTGLPPP